MDREIKYYNGQIWSKRTMMEMMELKKNIDAMINMLFYHTVILPATCPTQLLLTCN